MSKPTNIDEYLATLDEPLRQIAGKVRPIIDAALPEGSGALWHAHPVWSLGPAPGKSPVALIKAFKSHVTFGLWKGQEVTDPSGRLVPGSQKMASVKLRSVDDIDEELFTGWLRQAQALEG